MVHLKRVLGPLDKRKRLTRCQSCSARRIKCEGGIPCEYCSRTRKIWLPQTPGRAGYKFIAVTEVANTPAVPRRNLRTKNDSVYIDLFAAFIQRCQFTVDFVSVDKDLSRLIFSSHLLHDLALAIGALEASRRGSCSRLHAPDSAHAMAFVCYGNALRALRKKLDEAGATHCEDVLWSTFLFGLFELASESSGERWAKHMFYGTSKILALTSPTRLSSSLHLKMFDAFRVLEANRAVLFGDDTLLSQPTWVSHHTNFQDSGRHEFSLWDPTGTIYNLKLQVAAYSKRLFEQIESIPQPLRLFHPTVQTLAEEGVEIGQNLCQWHQNYLERRLSDTEYTRLAQIDYHALVLFLCQNYSYYTCWDGVTIPSLTKCCVETHVKAIINLSKDIQAAPHVPGVLLLFALRMGGAHAADDALRGTIIQRLDAIYWEGFVVSERIKSDLQELWEYQRRQISPQIAYD